MHQMGSEGPGWGEALGRAGEWGLVFGREDIIFLNLIFHQYRTRFNFNCPSLAPPGRACPCEGCGLGLCTPRLPLL